MLFICCAYVLVRFDRSCECEETSLNMYLSVPYSSFCCFFLSSWACCPSSSFTRKLYTPTRFISQHRFRKCDICCLDLQSDSMAGNTSLDANAYQTNSKSTEINHRFVERFFLCNSFFFSPSRTIRSRRPWVSCFLSIGCKVCFCMLSFSFCFFCQHFTHIVALPSNERR
jgi:hypothetical protein